MASSHSYFPGGRERLEHAADDLARPRARDVVFQLCLEQLRIRQDDAELIVQPMEQQAQIW